MKQKNASFIFKLLLHGALSPLNYSVVITSGLVGDIWLCVIFFEYNRQATVRNADEAVELGDNPSGFRSCVLRRDKQK